MIKKHNQNCSLAKFMCFGNRNGSVSHNKCTNYNLFKCELTSVWWIYFPLNATACDRLVTMVIFKKSVKSHLELDIMQPIAGVTSTFFFFFTVNDCATSNKFTAKRKPIISSDVIRYCLNLPMCLWVWLGATLMKENYCQRPCAKASEKSESNQNFDCVK